MQDSLNDIETRGVSIYSDGREGQTVRLLADILRMLNEINERLKYPVYDLTVGPDTGK
jgi:hypothetical protein